MVGVRGGTLNTRPDCWACGESLVVTLKLVAFVNPISLFPALLVAGQHSGPALCGIDDLS